MNSTKATLLGALAQAPTPAPWQQETVACLHDATTLAAAQMLGEGAKTTSGGVAQCQRDALLDSLPKGSLLQVLRDGPAPPVGLLGVSPALVRAIAAALSGAKPRAGTEVLPSRIERSLAELFAQRLLANLAAKLSPAKVETALFVTPNQNEPMLGHQLKSRLPSGQYAAFTQSLALHPEHDTADLTVYFHFDYCNTLASDAALNSYEIRGAEARTWHRHMARVALCAPVATRCVLDRFSLPAGKVAKLKSGDVLPLPGLGLSDIVLELPHSGGPMAFGRGKLGALRRNKALQLHHLSERAATNTHTSLPSPPKDRPG